jgi:hypothetical protein
MDCELCRDEMALFGDDNAFVRYDNNSLSKGHILVVPRRHVADFFVLAALRLTVSRPWWTATPASRKGFTIVIARILGRSD